MMLAEMSRERSRVSTSDSVTVTRQCLGCDTVCWIRAVTAEAAAAQFATK